MNAVQKTYVVIPRAMKAGARLFVHPNGQLSNDLVCWYTRSEAHDVAEKHNGIVREVKDGEVV